jgi:2-dehydropantoate 2-reductase
MRKKQIVIIGLGGVGGYFGFKISKYCETNPGFNISFIARGQTYHALKENGLILHSPEFTDSVTRPSATFENIADVVAPDLVLICVKEYDLENVCRQLHPVISKKTILLPLMNGVDIYDRIRKIIPEQTIVPACVYVASHIKAKGVVEHKGNPGKIIIGKDEAHPYTPLEWIIDLFQKSKIEIELHDNPHSAIWTKFIFIASFGLVTAKYNSSFGAVCSDRIQKQEATEIMEEIKAIANRKSIPLRVDVVENTFRTALTFPPQTPSSIQLDINLHKGQSELDLLAGTIIRYGKELNIETPFTDRIYNELMQKETK